MRNPTALVAAAVLFVLALFALRADRPHAAQDAPAQVQKWEYTTETFNRGLDQKRLAELGGDGWDFCQALPGEGPMTMIFKRPLR
jgi:hypothetical protein